MVRDEDEGVDVIEAALSWSVGLDMPKTEGDGGVAAAKQHELPET